MYTGHYRGSDTRQLAAHAGNLTAQTGKCTTTKGNFSTQTGGGSEEEKTGAVAAEATPRQLHSA